MDEMEKLLAQLKAEYNEALDRTHASSPATPPISEVKRVPTQPSSPLDNLLADIKAEFENPQSNSSKPSATSENRVQPSVADNHLLEQLKAESQEQERLEKQRQQQALREQQRHEEQQRQRKRQALEQQAKEWLKQLNPRSEEGMWFEEFSYGYESKLEAAIHYLEALRESHR